MNAQPSPSSSVHRYIVLAVLLLAAGKAFTDENKDPRVAVVNDHEIRLSYVYEQIESLPLGEQIMIRERFDRFVDSLIQEEVLFQSMIVSDFADEPELRESVKHSVAEFLIERHVRDRIEVTDAQVREFYDEQASAIRGETVRASQIVLASRADCKALSESIDSQAEFGEVARSRSLDAESAARDGDIGRFMNHAGPFGFEEDLFEMEIGEMRVFDSELGCHLVRLTEHDLPPLPPYAEVEPGIRGFLQRQREAELLRELIDRAGEGVSVERFPIE